MALPGERPDGHDHIDDAIARGAAAILVTRPVPAPDPRGRRHHLRVPDGLAALGAVAAGWRRGSSHSSSGSPAASPRPPPRRRRGRAAARFTTLRTEGNRNNEVGLPLTVLDLGPEHGAAVLEMGMYVGGEIADLAAHRAARRSGS